MFVQFGYFLYSLKFRRIAFCLDVYNESVKAMRYPPDAYKKELKQAINANAKEERSIEELIKDMEDEFDE
jgi:26S proteasome regulatory subunit N3